MNKSLPALALTLALLACTLPGASTPMQTPIPQTPIITSISPSGQAPAPTPLSPDEADPKIVSPALINEVSSERLMANIQALAAIPSRHVNSATIGQAAETIYDRFSAAGGNLQVSYQEFPLEFAGVSTTQRNVIAILPGRDPSAGVVVVGAHYDSRTVDIANALDPAPGANDNATGTAALLEMARILADGTPRRTVIFVAFSAEEMGIHGSNYFVADLQSQGQEVYAMLALDILGNASGESGEGAIRVFSESTPQARGLARYLAVNGESALTGFDVQVQSTVDRPGRYSDHKSFSDQGFASARFIEAVENTVLQHSGEDKIETISPTYYRQAVQVALINLIGLGWGLPQMDAPTLSEDTISWRPIEGAAGYVLAFRREGNLEVDLLVEMGDVTSLTWQGLSGYDGVSIGAVDALGVLGLFSVELILK